MTQPQRGIFAEDSIHHHYLEYALGEADRATIVAALAKARSGAEATGARVVVAFGNDTWHRIAPDGVPDGLMDFEAIEGLDGASAPATQRDVLFWIHGAGVDQNLDAALAVHRALAAVATLELDEKGFTYRDSRDLTGFIDGTANPKDEAAREAALVPDGAPGAGGAFVLTQRWVHDLGAFAALPVADQERVIGRTKPDSVELEGDAMPPDSHVARTDLSAAKIYRRSAPFGSATEKGLYFLAFACDIGRFDLLLRSMYGADGDGVRDHLTFYSRAVTGSYWFAPSEEELESVFGSA